MQIVRKMYRMIDEYVDNVRRVLHSIILHSNEKFIMLHILLTIIVHDGLNGGAFAFFHPF